MKAIPECVPNVPFCHVLRETTDKNLLFIVVVFPAWWPLTIVTAVTYEFWYSRLVTAW